MVVQCIVVMLGGTFDRKKMEEYESLVCAISTMCA